MRALHRELLTLSRLSSPMMVTRVRNSVSLAAGSLPLSCIDINTVVRILGGCTAETLLQLGDEAALGQQSCSTDGKPTLSYRSSSSGTLTRNSATAVLMALT